MKRYYCPQYCDSRRGWTNIKSLASLSFHVANQGAKTFAEQHRVVTRTIKKPKGWIPDTQEY